MQFIGQFLKSDSGSCLLSPRNPSVMIPKLSVKREVHCYLWENEPSSNSVDIVREYSSVGSEENPVQDTLAALLVHS